MWEKRTFSNLFQDAGMVQRKLTLRKKWVKQRESTCSKSNMSNEANFEKRSYQLVGLDRVLTLLNGRKYQFCLQKLT